MWEELLRIVATAVLSSLVTLWLVHWAFDRIFLPRLERDVQRQLDRALEVLAPLIEERVRKGVLDAVAAIPSTEVLQNTTRAVTQTGVDLVGAGLNVLLGRRDRR